MNELDESAPASESDIELANAAETSTEVEQSSEEDLKRPERVPRSQGRFIF
jgi:hypothetical protein